MSAASERLQVLELIERGLISPAEGERLLRALNSATGSVADELDEPETTVDSPVTFASQVGDETEEVPAASDTEAGFPSQVSFWRHWWRIPLWVGVGITILGAVLVGWSYQNSGLSFWFACSWLPFLLGMGLMTLAWSAQKSRWLHLRIRQQKGERPHNITISLPLPLRLVSWFLHTFRRFIPQLEKTGVDELIMALEKTTSPQSPFTIEVDDGPDGEQVQIYIG